MRRFAIIIAGIGVMTTGLACQHTAGKCDCSPITPPCMKYGLYTPESAPVQEVAPGKIQVVPPAKTVEGTLPSGHGFGSGM